MAGRLAAGGVRTVVCEEHARVGDPVHCTGVLSADSFATFDLPECATLNQLTAVRFLSPRRHSRRLHHSGTTRDGDRSTGLRSRTGRSRARRGRRDPCRRAGHGARRRCAGVSAIVGGTRVDGAPRRAGLRRQLQISSPVRLRPADAPICRPRSGSCRHGDPVTSSCISARMSRPAGSPGPCRCCAARATFVRIGVMASRDIRGCYERMLAPRRRAVGRQRAEHGAAREDSAARCGRTHLRRSAARDRRRGGPGQADHRRRHPLQHRQRRAGRRCRARRAGADRLDAATLSAYERAWRAELADEFEAQHELRQVATTLSDKAIDSFFELAQTDGVMPIVARGPRVQPTPPADQARSSNIRPPGESCSAR